MSDATISATDMHKHLLSSQHLETKQTRMVGSQHEAASSKCIGTSNVESKLMSTRTAEGISIRMPKQV